MRGEEGKGEKKHRKGREEEKNDITQTYSRKAKENREGRKEKRKERIIIRINGMITWQPCVSHTVNVTSLLKTWHIILFTEGNIYRRCNSDEKL